MGDRIMASKCTKPRSACNSSISHSKLCAASMSLHRFAAKHELIPARDLSCMSGTCHADVVVGFGGGEQYV